jgi:GAF domain-containing protein
MPNNNKLHPLLERYEKVIELGREINRAIFDHQTLFDQLCLGVADIMDTDNTLLLAIHRPQINMLDLYCLHQGQQLPFQEKEFKDGSLCVHVLKGNKKTLVYHHRSVEDPKAVQCIISGTEDTPDAESMIFVPLIVRDSALGVLSLQHPDPNKYTAEDVRIMEMLGNQVALALSSQRLFRYLKGLNEAAEQLTQQLKQEQLLQDVVQRIKETSWADIVILFPYHKDKNEFGAMHCAGDFREPDKVMREIRRPDDLAWLVLDKTEPVYVKDCKTLHQELGGDVTKQRTGNFEQREGIASVAALPLSVNNEEEGVLFVNFRHEQRFDEPQKQLISGLASVAAIAIKNSRAFTGALQQRSDDLEALLSIASEINRTYDLDKVLEIILQKAQERIPAVTEVAILLYDSFTKTLEVKKWLGAHQKDLMGLRLYVGGDTNREGTGLSAWAFKNGQTVRLNNVETGTLPNGRPAKDFYYPAVKDTVSEMDILLQDETTGPLGVISLESDAEDAFSEDADRFLRNLAEQSVIAIKNAQAHDEIKKRAAELLSIQNVEKKIINRLDAKEILQEILNEALRLTGSKTGQIFLHHKERNDFSLEVHKGVPPRLTDGRFPNDKGILGHVFETKKTFNKYVCQLPVKDTYNERGKGLSWELVVPIKQGDEVLGIIKIEKPVDTKKLLDADTLDIYPFTQREEDLLVNLADLATIALQEAKHYRRTEHNKKVLDALRDIDLHIIAQEKDADTAMFFIVNKARELINAERGSLYVAKDMSPLSSASPSLTAYYSGDAEMGTKPIFIPDYRKDTKLGIVAHVIKKKKAYRTGNTKDDNYYEGHQDIHSELAIPLLSKEKKLLGVLNLESPREYAFDDESEGLLKLFAGQALVAIQNAHHYNDAAEQKSRFELLLDTARELGEIANLSQIKAAYDIILDKATKHSDSEVIIRRYDEANRQLVKVAIRNKRPTPPPETISVDDLNTNAQVFEKRRTILIPYTKRPPKGIAKPVRLDDSVNALLVTPIEFENYYGNLIFSHDKAFFFKDSDVDLVEGLAQQLAVTLHRLETTQKSTETADKYNKLAAVKDMESSAYQLTHRLGNDLGLVKSYVNNIKEVLANERIHNVELDKLLQEVVHDTSQVLSMSAALKDKIAKMDAKQAETVPVIELLPKEGETWSPLPPIPPHITLKIIIDDVLKGIRIKVVSGQITEILHTLVSNAIEAMPNGGEITLNAVYIDNTALHEGNKVHITISDNGPGIPRSAHKEVFDMFYSTKGSSGYGLWSARRYAQLNGGDLILDEDALKGAKFILTLPVPNVLFNTTKNKQ